MQIQSGAPPPLLQLRAQRIKVWMVSPLLEVVADRHGSALHRPLAWLRRSNTSRNIYPLQRNGFDSYFYSLCFSWNILLLVRFVQFLILEHQFVRARIRVCNNWQDSDMRSILCYSNCLQYPCGGNVKAGGNSRSPEPQSRRRHQAKKPQNSKSNFHVIHVT